MTSEANVRVIQDHFSALREKKIILGMKNKEKLFILLKFEERGYDFRARAQK